MARGGAKRPGAWAALVWCAALLAGTARCSSFEDGPSSSDAGVDTSAPDASSGADGGSDEGVPPIVGTPEQLVGLQARPRRIALDADFVYWRNMGPVPEAGPTFGQIMKTERAKKAGPIELARDIPDGDGLALANGFVYFGSGEGCGAPRPVRRVSTTGGAWEAVFTGCPHSNVNALVVSGLDVYFTTPNLVGAARDGIPRTLATGGAHLVAQDDTWIYFMADVPADSILRIDKGDASNTVRVFAPSQRAVAIAADETAVFWVTETGAVARLGRDEPSTPATILATKQSSVSAITLTATHVLWTNAGDGTIRRVKKTGGDAETIATAQDEPVAIAADDAGIYWLNRRAGTVMRIGR